MKSENYYKKIINDGKYQPFPQINIKDRTWPNNTIKKAPQWCSVDLRDGNQALYNPMNIEQKKNLFKKLVEIGFKEIEIGFPSASQTDFDFARILIEERLIPSEVTIQVLVQAREHLVKRTFEALSGAENVIIHLYNSTSPAQRRDVFRMEKDQIIDIAVSGVKMIKERIENVTCGSYRLEYSPESFSGTELSFARDICNNVITEWNPDKNGEIIINLPATVEMSTPNIHADQIEWLCRNLIQRDNVIVSVHAHNDRGCGIAASELALLAGADRVEGTLFGNGERTGNTDLLTMALNMYTQGVNPELNIYDVDEIKRVYMRETGMSVHPRHPYAGDLVYTAFSGSHQDAISKGLKARRKENRILWNVPYLPIDPVDVGRNYEAVVRINSQSGKGGTAYVLESSAGYELPKVMQPQFSKYVQVMADKSGRELEPQEITDLFNKEFVNRTDQLNLVSISVDRDLSSNDGKSKTTVDAVISIKEKEYKEQGEGDGILDALSKILEKRGFQFRISSYDEHALEVGSDARAAAYIGIELPNGDKLYGAGVDTDISIASSKALLSALNRAM